MQFTVEVYDSKTGVCVDRIPNVVSIRTEGDFYFIYPSIEEPGNRHRTFRIIDTELTTKSFLGKGKTLSVKLRHDEFPNLFPNVCGYRKVDSPDGREMLRVEYRPWGQDRIYSYMMSLGMIDYWEEQEHD